VSDDYYYLKAKYKGYRSRASYKLLEIEQKFSIFQKNQIVLDLGAAPGGWSQVASRKVGKSGKILAIDKAYISPFKEENIEIINRDIFDEKLKDFIEDNYGKIDVLLSDCSPNISGDYSRDHFTQIYLANRALELSQSLLKQEGFFVCKLFQGSELQDFTNKVKESFESMKLFKPKSSRKKSAEIYIIGLKLKN
jgi:23S rRNA (uridine2552-2'-O)-methyltransferase